MSDEKFYIKSILDRKTELRSSEWYAKFSRSLATFEPGSKEIRCLALGSFTDFINPRFQLALLLLMAEELQIETITAWDPAFQDMDKLVLKHFNIAVTETDPSSAVWYVPHGPLTLVLDLPLKVRTDIYIGNNLNVFDPGSRDKKGDLEEYKKQAKIVSIEPPKQDRWFAAFSSTAIHQRQS